MVNPNVFTDQEYLQEVTKKINALGKGDRVVLTTMDFNPVEQPVNKVVRALIEASSRGANVHLLVDAFAFMVGEHGEPNGSFLQHGGIEASRSKLFSDKYALLEELRHAGGKYVIVNKPSTRLAIPFIGRSHIKLAIINNHVYLGGRNLGNVWQIDCMVGFYDKPAADYLWGFILNIENKGNVREVLHSTDQIEKIDDKTSLLIDAGKPGQSLIFETALKFIDEAEDWLTITCQYFPSDITAAHLARAVKRGVQVRAYYNHPNKHRGIGRVAQNLILASGRLRLPSQLFAHQLPANHRRIHAKLLASEKGAIIGSHNYISAGVRFGTAEIALVRQNPGFGKQLVDLLVPYLT